MTTQRPWRNRNKQAQWRSMDQLSPSLVMILHAWFSTIERHRLVKLTWNIHQTSLPLRWQWMGPSCHSLDLANHSHTHASAHHTFKARFSHIQEKSQCMHACTKMDTQKQATYRCGIPQLLHIRHSLCFSSDILLYL